MGNGSRIVTNGLAAVKLALPGETEVLPFTTLPPATRTCQ